MKNNQSGFILIDALICISIVEIMVIILFNSLNLNEKVNNTIKSKIATYDNEIAEVYKESFKCSIATCEVLKKE